jgi:hypothetical protein
MKRITKARWIETAVPILVGSALLVGMLGCHGTKRQLPLSGVSPSLMGDVGAKPQAGASSESEPKGATQPEDVGSGDQRVNVGTLATPGGEAGSNVAGLCSKDAGTCTKTDSAAACSGCLVDGRCVLANAVDSANPCRLCDPVRNPTGWSNADGRACDDGTFCTVDDLCGDGVCAGRARTCEDGVTCNGVSECDEAQGICTPAINQCGANSICDATTGACVNTCTGCLVDGTCLADGAIAASNACLVCDVTRSSTALSIAAGKSCGSAPTPCSAQDSCNEQGQCVPNDLPAGQRCGNQPTSCANPDTCDGNGNCLSRASARVEVCDGVDNDCNGIIDDGIDLSSDRKNCGVCDRNCGTSACNGGVCAPQLLAATSATGVAATLAVSADDVYWSVAYFGFLGGGVFRTPKNATGQANPIVTVDETDTALGVATDQTDLFWLNTTEVLSAQLRGVPRPALATTSSKTEAIAVAGNFIYWVEDFPTAGQGAAYFRINKTGGAVEPLGTSDHLATRVAAQGNCGYFASDGITRSCAGSAQLFFAGLVDSVAADASGVYFVGTGSGLKKLPLDLSGTPTVLAPEAQRAIAVDGQFVYYINGATGLGTCGTNWSVSRVSKNGGNATPVVLPPQACPQALAVDGTSIYWTNFDSGELFKAAK